jgi:hypothetical protein
LGPSPDVIVAQSTVNNNLSAGAAQSDVGGRGQSHASFHYLLSDPAFHVENSSKSWEILVQIANAAGSVAELVGVGARWVGMTVAARAAGARAAGAVAARGAAEANVVYRSVTAAGQVQYVGITNNLARRAAEHLAGRGIQVEKVLGGLSRGDARAVEQALIEIHGLGKNGGTLLNRINSIAPSNPAYAQQVQRGYELLQSIGY